MAFKVLITGGAGFVGSSLGLELKRRHPTWEVTALDNLKRRGSELCLARLKRGGVPFVHGDVRVAEDVDATGPCDVVLECSAEPSVLAGLDGSPAYVLQTNLGGTINCLEHARRHGAGMLFLSTSRVYPIAPITVLPLRETDTRFEFDLGDSAPPGVSAAGISEEFGLEGARSIYGATKLCSELLIQEYVAAYDMPAIIDRCGLLAGPWQMGKVDQGVMMYWVASHVFGRRLSYIGYSGSGKQVRDVLHVADLGELVDRQLQRLGEHAGQVFNVGGGRPCSTSLLELTEHCVAATGQRVPIDREPQTRPADIPIYLTDARRVAEAFHWSPAKTVEQTVDEIAAWVRMHNAVIRETLFEG